MLIHKKKKFGLKVMKYRLSVFEIIRQTSIEIKRLKNTIITEITPISIFVTISFMS